LWVLMTSFTFLIGLVLKFRGSLIMISGQPFRGFPFIDTPPTAIDVVIPDPTLEDFAVGTPSAKILAKAKASQKRKASTSGAT
ncbi:hypothetical protein Tco_0203314, partial [Tanacetum coccineum]